MYEKAVETDKNMIPVCAYCMSVCVEECVLAEACHLILWWRSLFSSVGATLPSCTHLYAPLSGEMFLCKFHIYEDTNTHQ